MTTKISLYNGALRLIGQQSLASLSENGVARRSLDEVYDDGLVQCLEQGQWNFAIRTIEIYENADATPAFGYQYAFDKSDDWVRTVAVSVEETFAEPYLRYQDETDYWYADVEPLYIRYVSKDAELGLDLSRWPMTFARAVEAWLALEICERITSSGTKRAELEKIWRKRIVDARSKDALNEAAVFPPPGTWVKARRAGRGSWRRER